LFAYGTSLLGVFSGLLSSLWLLRKVTQVVTPETFGVYAFALQITSYLGTVQLGLDFAASRRMAESLGQGLEDEARKAYWVVQRFNIFASLVAVVLTLIVAAGLRAGIGVIVDRSLAGTTALLTGGAVVVGFLAQPFDAALIGSQQQALVNGSVVVRSVAATVLAYFLLRAGMGVLCLPAANLVCGIAYALFVRWLAHWRCPWLAGERPVFQRDVFRVLMRFGAFATLGSVAWTIEATSDVVILGWGQGAVAVGLYVLWWRFPSMLFDFCSRLVTSAFPSFAERQGVSPLHATQLLSKVGILSAGLGSAALVGASLWLPALVHLWLGDAYAVPDPRTIALLMGALVCLRTFGNLFGMFWISDGEARPNATLAWVQAAVKVGLALVLVPSLGIKGVLIASCIASLVQVVGAGFALRMRRQLDGAFVVNAAALLALAFIVAMLSRRGATTSTLPGFALGAGITATIWSCLWAVFAWHSELRPNLAAVLRRIAIWR
jgi:O-antigen/teichoic acid export membrane protein